MLNTEQQAALAAMLDFLQESNPAKTFLLEGRPGTGKTYLMQELMQVYKKRTVFTAPTNKATKVLKQVLTTDSYKPDCCTIYSLLGLSLTSDGEVREVTAGDLEVDLSRFSLVVIDEAFMIAETVKQFIDTALLNHKVKIIFMGDSYQLPPVKESKSAITNYFTESSGNQALLTQIMRNSGVIAEVVEEVRTAIDRVPLFKLPFLERRELYQPDSPVQLVTGKNFNKLIANHEWQSNQFTACKVVAWRNVTVNSYNAIVRSKLFPNTYFERPFEVGDQIVVTSPARDLDGKFFATVDEEGVVSRIVNHPHPWLLGIDCESVTCSMSDNTIKTFRTLAQNSTKLFEKMLSDLANDARIERRKWKQYYALFEAVHYIRPSYAITAHRSQGSTYDKVFVDLIDILKNSNRKESLQCLLVAMSRARTKLIITSNKG